MTFSSYVQKTINVGVGYTNYSGSYSCTVHQYKSLGSLYITPTKSNEEIGYIHVSTGENSKVKVYIEFKTVDNSYGSIVTTRFLENDENIYIYINKAKVTLIDDLGNSIGSCIANQLGGGEFLGSPGPVNLILAIGIAEAEHPIGSYGVDGLLLSIYDKYYDSVKSSCPPTVSVEFNYVVPPVIYDNLIEYVALGTNKNNEVDYYFYFPKTASGYNYVSDLEQNTKLVIDENGLYQKDGYFNSAYLSFRLGGVDYFNVDLLKAENGYVSENVCLPAGRFTDASYHLKVNPKVELGEVKFNLKAHLRFWYDSSYPPCDSV